MKNQVVILAGGLGTRLRPITEKIPKPMVEVAGKPFLHWQLEDARLQGYTRILLLVAYLGEQIRAYFGDGRDRGLDISYSFEPEPMGTGGALKLALGQLDSEFVLLNGDSFLRAPLADMGRAFAAKGWEALMATYDNRVATPVIPNVRTGPDGLVEAYKKDAGLAAGFDKIDAGVYLMKRGLIESAPEGRFQVESLWPAVIARGKLGAYPVAERFYDIGTPERLKEFEEKVRDYFQDSVSR